MGVSEVKRCLITGLAMRMSLSGKARVAGGKKRWQENGFRKCSDDMEMSSPIKAMFKFIKAAPVE